MFASKGSLVGIKPRNLKPEFKKYAINFYYKDDPYITTFWNCLSLLFPQGEKFFVDSVKNYRSAVTDKKLLSEISGFIGQESFHSREHSSLNDLISRNCNTSDLDYELKLLLDIAKKLPNSWQLAITCSLEHFTGIMGHQLLNKHSHYSSIMYDYLNLWIWHAIEECEHKCVAFDLYKDQVDSYLIRILIMIAATIVFFTVVSIFYLRLLFKKGLYNPLKIVYSFGHLSYLFKDLLFDYFSYFSPNFHPSDQDSAYLIDYWLKYLDLK